MKLNINRIIAAVILLSAVSCQQSDDILSKISRYSNTMAVTITVTPDAPTAQYNNDRMAVTITASVTAASIKYTINDSDPGRTYGTDYTVPVIIDSAYGTTPVVIKAVLYDANRISAVASVTVTLGDGTSAAAAYEIASPAQLENMSINVNSGTHSGSFFKQVADIDLSSYSAPGWTPIGTNGTPFTGSYDGGSFTISNLFINDAAADYQGLFGYLSTSGTLFNINLVNVDITGRNFVGALAGAAGSSTGSITNCTASGTAAYKVTGNSSVGGLVGFNGDMTPGIAISGCSSALTVTGSMYTGGLVGQTDSTTISGSGASGVVTGTDSLVGGFAGTIRNSIITECYARGNVSVSGTGIPDGAGGFSGSIMSGSDVQKCFARGDVTVTSGSYDNVGGFAGNNNSLITNCYSTGNVVSDYIYSGGFIGGIAAGSTITNCYSAGMVTGSATKKGGFIGNDLAAAGSYTSCYWLQEGANSSLNNEGNNTALTGVTPETQILMKTESTYLTWDFDPLMPWRIDAGTTYPYLYMIETGNFPQ